jgi:hypothetical protein
MLRPGGTHGPLTDTRTDQEKRMTKDLLLGAKSAANAAPTFAEQYIGNLRQYLAIDAGDQDGLKVDTGKLHDVLESYGIANRFEIYDGTPVSNVAFRFQDDVIPFFSKNLASRPQG